jgi:hypothetical protein
MGGRDGMSHFVQAGTNIDKPLVDYRIRDSNAVVRLQVEHANSGHPGETVLQREVAGRLVCQRRPRRESGELENGNGAEETGAPHTSRRSSATGDTRSLST